jgi:hypothetical protein
MDALVELRHTLENIRDFAHQMHAHPDVQLHTHFPAGSAMEEIALTADKALKETQS